MTINQRRVPLETVHFPTPDASNAAKTLFYMNELDRQAEIACTGLVSALERGLQPSTDSRDPLVWSSLQSTLFATICIVRLLRPGHVQRVYPGMSKSDSQTHADDRGTNLRTLLEIEESSAIFDIVKVRDAFEHYDERIDARFVGGATCISDWYISSGMIAVTPAVGVTPQTAIGLRVFYPAGGQLSFDSDVVDLFALDIALLNLRINVKEKGYEIYSRIKGRGRFGGHQIAEMSSSHAQARRDEWARVRAEALADLNDQ